MEETKSSRDAFRSIQALWALRPVRGGVGLAYRWQGGRIPVGLSRRGVDENDGRTGPTTMVETSAYRAALLTYLTKGKYYGMAHHNRSPNAGKRLSDCGGRTHLMSHIAS